MITVTKEQIKEVLERFRSYNYWMYYTKDAIIQFNKQIREVDNQKFNISLTKEGFYKLSLIEKPEIYAIIQTYVLNCPVKEDSIDNVTYKCQIMNPEQIPVEYRAFFEKISVFTLSGTQRACAFQFFARLQDESIEGISNDLMSVNEKV